MNRDRLHGNFRLGLAIIFIAVGATIVSARRAEEPITQIKVKRFEVREALMHQLVWEVSTRYGVPIGFERLADEADTRLVYVSVNMWNTTVGDVLNDICLGDRRYTWELHNGVIHVFPVAHRDPVIVELLNTKIAKVSLNKTVSNEGLRGMVERLPEVAAVFDKHHLMPSVPLRVDLKPRHFPARIDLTNVTLSEILDELVKQTDSKSWFLSIYGINGALIVIKFE